MLSIRSRVVLACMLIFGLVLIGFAYYVYDSTKLAEFAKIDARLDSHCEKIETDLEEQLLEAVFPVADDFHEIRTDGLAEVRLQIWDSLGNVVLPDSILVRSSESSWRNDRLLVSSFSTLQIQDHSYRLRWFPIEMDERVPYVAQLATPLTGLQETLSDLRTLFSFSIPAVLIFTSLAIWWITGHSLKPLRKISESASQLSEKTLDTRLDIPRSKDEVRSLAITLNEMLARLDAAFQSQRQFVADASHELRTPLTVLTSELEYALKQSPAEPVKESLEVSLDETERLTTLANSLLYLARLESTQSKLVSAPVRLDELITECVARMKRISEKRQVTISLHIDEVVEIDGDRDMLSRAFLNVLDNACKYTPSGKGVYVHLKVVSIQNLAHVIISDEGIGVPKELLPRLGERFYRTPEARAQRGGAGLGLSITRKLIEMHGGSVLIESEVSKGMTVTLQLPLKKQTRQADK